jgi:hypothetical protein
VTKLKFIVLVGILFFVADPAHANNRRPIGRVFGGAARAIGATARFGGAVVAGTAIGGARIIGGTARLGGRIVAGTAIGGARIIGGAARLTGRLAAQPFIGAGIAIQNARERRAIRQCLRCSGPVVVLPSEFGGQFPGPESRFGGDFEPVSLTGNATPVSSHGNASEITGPTQEAALPINAPTEVSSKERAVSDSPVTPGANFRVNVGAGSCLATMVPAETSMPQSQCQAVVANSCLPDDALPEKFNAGSSVGETSLAGKAVEAFPGSEGTKTVRLRFACPTSRELVATMPVEIAEQLQQRN